jgi:hypothetical protein
MESRVVCGAMPESRIEELAELRTSGAMVDSATLNPASAMIPESRWSQDRRQVP